jgi:hypothetical protein
MRRKVARFAEEIKLALANFHHFYRRRYKIERYDAFKITTMKLCIATLSLLTATAVAFTPSSFVGNRMANVPQSTSALEMKYKVAVVGGGPSGACAAEIFAQEKNIDTVFFERKMDNAKPCGGAIPLCMIGEFDLPESVVDRKVSNMF